MGGFDLISATLLMAYSLSWALLSRYASTSVTSQYAGKMARLPSAFWMIAGSAFFLLPVIAYWLGAYSHGNAIAGFLPWNDAAGYQECSEGYLLGAETSTVCDRRPFYIALFTDLLWLSGNNLQMALLMQAALLGGAAVLLLGTISEELDSPAVLAVYSVLFLFAAKYCAALIMTENAGLILGCLAIALLWRSARTQSWPIFYIGLGVMAAALNARAGAMFVLPAAIGWVLFHFGGSLRNRVVLAGFGFAMIVVGFTVTNIPTLIVEGNLGIAQSNFSYSLYGLAVGGKGWQQVLRDHPEFFTQSNGVVEQTRAIYHAAFENILSKPHLLILGYLKGLNHYAGDLFKFAHDFKPLRFLIFTPLWLAGVWFAVRRWRDPRYALLLWLQAGILASSPFITFDGGNRVYAATIPVDALFVGLGVMLAGAHIAPMSTAVLERGASAKASVLFLALSIAMVLVPIGALIAIRLNSEKVQYSKPVCTNGLEPVVVRPGRSTLVLPLVTPGEETVFPLRVRADYLAQRLHKSVHHAFEFIREAGTVLVWGIQLDTAQFGRRIMFVWKGSELPAGEAVGFCVKLPKAGSGRNIGTAVEINRSVDLR